MSLPKRWLPYSPVGKPIPGTPFVAFKVPLKEKLCRRVPSADRFSPEILLSMLPDLSAVVDLTFTNRYYDGMLEFAKKGIFYKKVAIPGKEVPTNRIVNRFFDAVDAALARDSPKGHLIGVHCTHGVNRTGHLICKYMIDRLGINPDEAISLFEDARGHKIERENYLDDLRQRGSDQAPKNRLPRRSRSRPSQNERRRLDERSAPVKQTGNEFFNRNLRTLQRSDNNPWQSEDTQRGYQYSNAYKSKRTEHFTGHEYERQNYSFGARSHDQSNTGFSHYNQQTRDDMNMYDSKPIEYGVSSLAGQFDNVSFNRNLRMSQEPDNNPRQSGNTQRGYQYSKSYNAKRTGNRRSNFTGHEDERQNYSFDSRSHDQSNTGFSHYNQQTREQNIDMNMYDAKPIDYEVCAPVEQFDNDFFNRNSRMSQEQDNNPRQSENAKRGYQYSNSYNSRTTEDFRGSNFAEGRQNYSFNSMHDQSNTGFSHYNQQTRDSKPIESRNNAYEFSGNQQFSGNLESETHSYGQRFENNFHSFETPEDKFTDSSRRNNSERGNNSWRQNIPTRVSNSSEQHYSRNRGKRGRDFFGPERFSKQNSLPSVKLSPSKSVKRNSLSPKKSNDVKESNDVKKYESKDFYPKFSTATNTKQTKESLKPKIGEPKYYKGYVPLPKKYDENGDL